MRFKDIVKGIIFGPWGRIYWTPQELLPTPTIESLLARANGNRRIRLLNRSDIDEIIQDCRNAHDGHWTNRIGGLVARRYGWPAWSTYSLAAKIDGNVYVGITTIDASEHGTPVSGWRELAYLSVSGDQRRAEKLRSWRDDNLNKSVVCVPSV
jgi:hypothetical protein